MEYVIDEEEMDVLSISMPILIERCRLVIQVCV